MLLYNDQHFFFVIQLLPLLPPLTTRIIFVFPRMIKPVIRISNNSLGSFPRDRKPLTVSVIAAKFRPSCIFLATENTKISINTL